MPSILIVDDSQSHRQSMGALLGDLDCRIVLAASGEEALRHLDAEEFALMLLDVQMPGMDGFEVARRARQSPKALQVPIFFLTGSLDTDEKLLRGYGSGAVDVMAKPVHLPILRSKVSVFLDLHRGRRALAREIEDHKRTMAELDAFNYSVSHDLRAPLRPILGFGQILLEEHAESLEPEARNLLERIISATRRMDGLINSLLRLSSIRRARPASNPVDLSEVVRAIVEELRAEEPTRVVEVVIPPALEVLGDEPLLRVALENLLRNAWKFTRKAEAARIEIGRVEDESKGTCYFVRDNGIGFDPQRANQLFAPFTRLHPNHEYEGTGIGLTIVQRVVRHHRGEVWAIAEPGNGATFLFTLPGP